MNYARGQRLRMIDFLLGNYGAFRRSALMDYFGLSTPQTSLDIAEYIRLAPSNIAYDASARAYVRGPKFVRIFP